MTKLLGTIIAAITAMMLTLALGGPVQAAAEPTAPRYPSEPTCGSNKTVCYGANTKRPGTKAKRAYRNDKINKTSTQRLSFTKKQKRSIIRQLKRKGLMARSSARAGASAGPVVAARGPVYSGWGDWLSTMRERGKCAFGIYEDINVWKLHCSNGFSSFTREDKLIVKCAGTAVVSAGVIAVTAGVGAGPAGASGAAACGFGVAFDETFD